jgi:AcrR family transcriptional regulator
MDPPSVGGMAVDPALGRLHSRAFAWSALDEIARGAGISEADLRDRYRDREALIRELVTPLLCRLALLTTSAAAADLRQPRELRAVIAGYMDALLLHGALVPIILADPAGGSSEAVRLVRDAIEALRDELARGSESQLEGRIRAASALGAVQAAVLEPSDFDPVTVRDVIAGAAVAILLS